MGKTRKNFRRGEYAKNASIQARAEETKTRPPPVQPEAKPEPEKGRFFRPVDWSAFAATFIVAMGLYIFTLAPTVTLEDSGELVVAADYLGVPHPPGYPVWTVIAWLFTRIFAFVKHNGYPNPAYGVNMTSAFFGALTCAMLALLVSRSGVETIEGMRGTKKSENSRALHSIMAWASGVSAGLMLAFGHLMWSQSVIAEVYTINAFLHMAIFLLAYLWMRTPENNRLLCLTALLFGVAITNCQPVILIIMALLAVFWRGNRALFRDSLLVISPVAVLYVIVKIRNTAREIQGPMPFRNIWELLLLSLLAAATVAWAIKLVINTRSAFTEWKRLLLIALFVALGLTVFVYMPIASDFNPPMNWGYTRTWEGFKHAVTRGQYQKLDPAVLPEDFLRQATMFFTDLELRWSFLILLPAVIPAFFIHRLNPRCRTWFAIMLIAFVFLSVIFMALLNPSHDIQALFIAKVQFLQADMVLCMWLGYSMLLGMTALSGMREQGQAMSREVMAFACLAALLLPGIPLAKNYFDKNLILAHSCAELNGHDFGWQFGYYQLRGANGIREELAPDESPLPNPDFPLEMTENAIFFGGTDPGRFVPTYMIYSALCRPDVYLITQNALADNTYMHVMRDLYGDSIWLPSAHDCNNAFQRYVTEVREGRIPPNAAITISPDGRVSVQGVQGVMEINGLICRMIFDVNKHKHDFYVEESYVIAWMYPYLEPHGLIMKINKEPLPELPQEMVKNDKEFWDWYSARLLRDPKFQRDMVAQKTFSKLRCAIAGIYAFRRMTGEAEYAFRQAIDLYPLSPEANFRLADLYIQGGRFADAHALMEAMARGDKRNTRVRDFAAQIKQMQTTNEQISQLQSKLHQGQGTLEDALTLASLFHQVNRMDLFNDLANQILNNDNIPPEAYLRIAEMYKTMPQPQHQALAEIYRKFLERNPSAPGIWIEMASVQIALNNPKAAIDALRQAVAIGGEPVRDILRKDPRLNPIRHIAEFQQLTAPTSVPIIPGMTF